MSLDYIPEPDRRACARLLDEALHLADTAVWVQGRLFEPMGADASSARGGCAVGLLRMAAYAMSEQETFGADYAVRIPRQRLWNQRASACVSVIDDLAVSALLMEGGTEEQGLECETQAYNDMPRRTVEDIKLLYKGAREAMLEGLD